MEVALLLATAVVQTKKKAFRSKD